MGGLGGVGERWWCGNVEGRVGEGEKERALQGEDNEEDK